MYVHCTHSEMNKPLNIFGTNHLDEKIALYFFLQIEEEDHLKHSMGYFVNTFDTILMAKTTK